MTTEGDREPWLAYWQAKDGDAFDLASQRSGRVFAMQRLGGLSSGRLGAGAVSVEIGCGTGLFANTTGQPNIIGVDLSLSMLRVARTRMGRVLQADLFSLPFRVGSVDNVVCAFVLDDYSSDDKAWFLRSLRNTLTADGRLFFAAYSPSDEHMGRERRREELKPCLETKDGWIALMEAAGFSVTEAETVEALGQFGDAIDSSRREFIVISAGS
jgi:SAM-dependent methyltransferase